jgi:hypothetical protein
MRKIDIIAKQQIGCGLSVLGGLLTGGASVFEVVYILSSLNFSLFQKNKSARCMEKSQAKGIEGTV